MVQCVQVSNSISGFMHFPLQFYPFCVMYFDNVIRCIHIKNCCMVLEYWPLYHYVKPHFTPDNFLALKSVLSEINMPIFLLVLAWYIFITFKLDVSLYLKWVSYRQCIVGFCFLVHSDNLYFFICLLRSLIFKVIIDMVGLIYAIFVGVFFLLSLFIVFIVLVHFSHFCLIQLFCHLWF